MATCEECLELALADCATCPKPDGLDAANHLALDCWQMVMEGEPNTGVIMQVVVAMDGTKDDVEKVFLISKIYREINPQHGRED